MEPERNVGGRPAKWEDPEAFDRAVDEYFADDTIYHTWSGLALHLGFESRQSLEDYKKKDGFSYPIKKALLRIESQYEMAAMINKNAAGPIFALKNFGWKDKQEVEMNANMNTRVLSNDPLGDAGNDSTQEDKQPPQA